MKGHLNGLKNIWTKNDPALFNLTQEIPNM